MKVLHVFVSIECNKSYRWICSNFLIFFHKSPLRDYPSGLIYQWDCKLWSKKRFFTQKKKSPFSLEFSVFTLEHKLEWKVLQAEVTITRILCMYEATESIITISLSISSTLLHHRLPGKTQWGFKIFQSWRKQEDNAEATIASLEQPTPAPSIFQSPVRHFILYSKAIK